MSSATMASSSRMSLAPPPRSIRPQSDSFRPRLPVDPFSMSIPALREPWLLKHDTLLSTTATHTSHVVLVIGEPTLNDLAPLLQSRLLAYSLVIIATNQPPELPHITIPAVRILRLSKPLAIENDGAVRLVNVLEWAERVARVWRAHGGNGILELTEETDAQEHLAPPPLFRFGGSRSSPSSPSSSPGSSVVQLVSTPPSPPRSPTRGSSPLRPSRPRSVSSGKFLTKSRDEPLPPMDPTQRAFDALVNFIPPVAHEKSLLKHALLVTTISRPFLTAANVSTAVPRGSRYHSASDARPAPPGLTKRSSFLSSLSLRGSSSSLSLSQSPPIGSGDSVYTLAAPPARAHLVHLLPLPPPTHSPGASRQRTALVNNIEAFLLSFGFPQSSSLEAPHERPRPYLMPTHVFSASVPCPADMGSGDWAEWTVTDVLLSGALDDAGAAPRVGTGAGARKRSPRAWLGGPADVVVLPGGSARASAPATMGGGEQMTVSDVDLSADVGYPFPDTRRRQASGTGLPTPPESEESGEEKQKENHRVLKRGRDSGSEKSGRMRWRFWKKAAAK